MNDTTANTNERVRPHKAQQTLILVVLIVAGFALVVVLSRWLESHRPPVNLQEEEERLYVTGNTARRMSMGFNGLVADWYWMRSLQYVGRKIVQAQDNDAPLDDLSALNLTLLYPLLDATTTIDPKYMAAYEFGGVVLPAINPDDAIKLLRKGIEANPSEWRLHQHLGYIYWKRGDYKTASEVYAEGATKPDAPPWLRALSARMVAEGGSRDTAREMYRRMYDEAGDEQVKEMAARRLLQIDSFDERDAIRQALDAYRQRTGRCASAWKDVIREMLVVRVAGNRRLRLDDSGAPLDPADKPYRLVKDGCDVDLDWRSKVPYK